MDISKLASLGEKIKTGGSQMGRMVSEKFKDLVQTPTPESKMVDEATLETMEEPNWGLNLRICAMLNSEEFSGSEIVKAIKKKISSKSVVSQRLSLDLLEACAMNCEKVFSEVASEKVLDEMVRLIDSPQTDNGNRDMALQLIRAWGESEDLAYLPVFRQTYMSLRQRTTAPPAPVENSPPIPYSLDPFADQQPLNPPERYPIPNTEFHGPEQSYMPFNYDIQSIEEKKEFLSVTRNSLELFSSILNSETDAKAAVQDDLLVSMVEKCKQSQPGVKRIVETTVEDEVMLFDALTLHDELQQVIARYEEIESTLKSNETPSAENSTSIQLNLSNPPENHLESSLLADSPKKFISESSGDKKSIDEEK